MKMIQQGLIPGVQNRSDPQCPAQYQTISEWRGFLPANVGKVPYFFAFRQAAATPFRDNTESARIALGGAMEEYVTVAELAERLKLSKKSIRNKMSSGDFREGVHYFRPKGMAPRFKWSAIVAWVEDGAIKIPMARGYALRQTLDTGNPIDTILPRSEHIKRASGKIK
jgi:hypothetical protein